MKRVLILIPNKTIDKKSSHNPYMQDYAMIFCIVFNWCLVLKRAVAAFCDNALQIVCPYLRLTAETKFDVPDGTSLGFKPPARNSF